MFKHFTTPQESKIEHISKVVVTLSEVVKTRNGEKKKYGEVMTPISLVEDMLNKLPPDVWGNPRLRWLDACNGCGIFPSIVVKRLMVGLKWFEEDEEKRYKHILEKMLFVAEIQKKNMDAFTCLFNPNNNLTLNTYTGSFLDKSFDRYMEEVWGVEKFDIIVGNPPYQTEKNSKNKSSSLWDKFIIKSLSILTEGGFLVYVHPSGWRNIQGKAKHIQNLLKSRQMLYLSIHDAKEGKKTFGAITRYDWYCLQNKLNPGILTRIRFQDGSIEDVDISKMEFIPNGMFKEITCLLAKDGEEKVAVLSNSIYHPSKNHMSRDKSRGFIYPCVQNVNTKGECSKIFYSSINKGHFIPKVIFGTFGINSYADLEGEYGMCQHCAAIVDKIENIYHINQALQHPQFKKIMKFCYMGGIQDSPINKPVLALLRKDFWKQFISESFTSHVKKSSLDSALVRYRTFAY